MRKIKFRAWDKQLNHFANGANTRLAIQSNGTITELYVPENSWNDDEEVISKGYVLMQFTGLKDKNGKEIFEGDIIDGRYGIHPIRWSDNHCGFVPFAWPSNAPDNEESEVIGNIYENSELLGVGK